VRRLVTAVPAAALLVAVACADRGRASSQLPVVEARPQTIELTAAADGVVEPVRSVEVKSKSSGEIIAIHADTGDLVEEGQVLLQLLPRDAQNLYDQAAADLEAAQARYDNARVQLERARRLHAEGLLPPSDLEAAELASTGARTEVVRAQKNLDNAAERLAETTVRSPISGTVIAKSVEVGQVIASAVSQVSGGTLLFTLADLDEVQVRSLVDEVDVGRLRAGLEVEIRVEAYPERRFHGQLLKIEPQAVVEQNVTMFPVLTRIANREGLLKPGMNAEVEILIERREDVLALPNEAVKRPPEALAVAQLLGIAVPESAPADARPGGGPRAGRPAAGGRPPAGEPDRRMVFTVTAAGYELRPVRVGLRNWEVTEILSGLEPGDRVALVPSAAQLRQSQEFRDRVQRMRGLPGQSQPRPRSGGS
jgi:HlyD family secretion protein